MIAKIDIAGTVPFGDIPQAMDGLKQINFIFGANGVGKTTISRILDHPSRFPECGFKWNQDLPLKILVYNRDFVDQNFNAQKKLKGVFTLGEIEADTLARIESINNEIEQLDSDIIQLNNTLNGADGKSGINGELANLETEYKTKFWSLKKKYDDTFPAGIKGFRNDSEKFKNRLLEEATRNNSLLTTLAELEQKSAFVFSKNLIQVQPISALEIGRLLDHEENPVLRKRVIGRSDVDIAAMIDKLGNSDWVRQGRLYFEDSNGICPFCQQLTNEIFARSLLEFFDESYESDSRAISELVTDYAKDADFIHKQIQALIETPSDFFDDEKLKDTSKALDALIDVNKQKLLNKNNEVSQVTELSTLKQVLTEINDIINTANKSIHENNAIINNHDNEMKALTSQIWRFLVEEAKVDIEVYTRKKRNFDKAAKSISNQINTKVKERKNKEIELLELEKKRTSVKYTCFEINDLLKAFGFRGFKLETGDDSLTYKLIRSDGSDAQDTLSEGEKSFITFLYFYHLLKGSHEESGVNLNRIVVFDDPISSLDNEVLFIVSTLIKELFDDIRNNRGNVKQIFILTHNIYFHKEVSYNRKRADVALKDESFWLIRRLEDFSRIEKQAQNPVRTSYEFLWSEVRNPERNNSTIQNTLRRILEYYFKLLGGISIENLYKEFEGEKKIICKSLCSWINDGSHNGFDEDYYTSLDDVSVQKYLEVFREIFVQNKHLPHYDMMMGNSNKG